MTEPTDAFRYRVRIGDRRPEGTIRGGDMHRDDAYALAERIAAQDIPVRVERAPRIVQWAVDPDGPDTLTTAAGPEVQQDMTTRWKRAAHA